MSKKQVQAKEFLTVAELCDMFDVTPKTVHNWIAEGKLPGSFKAGVGRTQPFLIPTKSAKELKERLQSVN